MLRKLFSWFAQSMSPCSNITKKPSGSWLEHAQGGVGHIGEGRILDRSGSRGRAGRIGYRVVLDVAAGAAVEAEELTARGQVDARRGRRQAGRAIHPGLPFDVGVGGLARLSLA